MSEWCANCHGEMLENAYVSGNAGHVHPAGNNAKLTAEIAGFYNTYVKSGDMTGVGAVNSMADYTSLIPFELGITDYTQLKTKAVIDGTEDAVIGFASTSNNVMCLSCHRVHASGYESMLRFPHAYEFMTNFGTGAATYPVANSPAGQGLTPAMTQTALYDRQATVFSGYQRVLCNKCHAKD